MNAFERFRDTLEAAGCNPRGSGQLSARCPAHEDQTPSLSVGYGGGKALVKCHVGCEVEAVVDALELTMGDLFDEDAEQRPVCDHDRLWKSCDLVARYDYTDEHGRALYTQRRYRCRACAWKTFRPMNVATGKAGLPKGVRVLYRLPEVLAAVKAGRTVYVVEGEKDADRLATLDQVATTSINGAKAKWEPGYSDALKGADVVVIADNDEPGREHARTVAAALDGVAAKVRIMCSPLDTESSDVSDHLDAGHTLDDLVELVDPLDQVEVGSGSGLDDLLDEVHAAFTRYVVLPSPEAVDAVVLWCAATHAQTVADHAPRLVIKAPEKRCGKSRCLDIVEGVSFKPKPAVNATPAALYRSVEADEPPTLIFDEADTIFPAKGKVAEQNEELRGLLNAGHQRGRPALRVVGKGTEQAVAEFPTFAMAALAGIGNMPDTIEDRAIVITMRRRAPGETVAKFRYRRDQLPLHELRDRLNECIAGHLDALSEAEPDMPVEDRAADTWEPLIAIADVAGGNWPDRARQAAKTLTAAHEQADTGASLGVRLLNDCRTVFAAADDSGVFKTADHPDALKTADLLDGLKSIDDAPWAELGKNGLTARKLGDLLREYGIKSANFDFASGRTDRAKGYARSLFQDAWKRYCPPADADADADACQPYQAHQRSSPQVRKESMVRIDPYQETIRTALTSKDKVGTDGTAQREKAPCVGCGRPFRSTESVTHCHDCRT